MAAATQPRVFRYDVLNVIALPLAASAKATQNCLACVDTSAKVCKPGAASNSNLVAVGTFQDSVDNSANTATTPVMVRLQRAVNVTWFDNDTGSNAFAATDLFATAYIVDDHTVSKSSSGNSSTCRVWAVDPSKGVAVEFTSL